MASLKTAPTAVKAASERLVAQIAKKVPYPTPLEDAFWEAHQEGVSVDGLLDRYSQERAAWKEAERLWGIYVRQCSVGESYAHWFRRANGSSRTSIPFEPPPPAQVPPCFAQLGLTWPCTEEQVSKAWKRQAATSHPDRGGDPQVFIRLTQARDEALDYLAAQRSYAPPNDTDFTGGDWDIQF